MITAGTTGFGYRDDAVRFIRDSGFRYTVEKGWHFRDYRARINMSPPGRWVVVIYSVRELLK